MIIRQVEKLISQMDQSVNFVLTGDFPGKIEARYVRRKPEYFACYVSSQSGCNQACRMCHLTAKGETRFENINRRGYLRQAREVFGYWSSGTKVDDPARIVHYNFMARGEALNNPHLTKVGDFSILKEMADLAVAFGLHPRFNISTIMPRQFEGSLIDAFPVIYPDFYYSIYSVDPEFRRRWLPNAKPVDEALRMLYDWQETTKKIVKLHWAFIRGENDSEADVVKLCNVVRHSGLKVDINIVRFNPPSDDYEESCDMDFDRNLGIMRESLPDNTKIDIIPRVGFDVFASCGTFA